MPTVHKPIWQSGEFPKKRDTREALDLVSGSAGIPGNVLPLHQETVHTSFPTLPRPGPRWTQGGLKEQCAQLRVLFNRACHHHCCYGSVIQKCPRLSVTARSIMRMAFPCFVFWTLKTRLAHRMSSGCHANYVTFQNTNSISHWANWEKKKKSHNPHFYLRFSILTPSSLLMWPLIKHFKVTWKGFL